MSYLDLRRSRGTLGTAGNPIDLGRIPDNPHQIQYHPASLHPNQYATVVGSHYSYPENVQAQGPILRNGKISNPRRVQAFAEIPPAVVGLTTISRLGRRIREIANAVRSPQTLAVAGTVVGVGISIIGHIMGAGPMTNVNVG